MAAKTVQEYTQAVQRIDCNTSSVNSTELDEQKMLFKHATTSINKKDLQDGIVWKLEIFHHYLVSKIYSPERFKGPQSAPG